MKMTFILTELKEGLGNKVFELLDAMWLAQRLKAQLYVAIYYSHHLDSRDFENLAYLFPNLLSSVPWVHFISWKEYDKKRIETNESFVRGIHANLPPLPFRLQTDYDFFGIGPRIQELLETIPKRTFWTNPELRNPAFSYSDGTLLHLRYGDKLAFNRKKSYEVFGIPSVQWYLNRIKHVPKDQLYVVTDSPEYVQKHFPSSVFERIVPANAGEVFYAATFMPCIVTADSTLTLSAACLHRGKKVHVYYRPIFETERTAAPKHIPQKYILRQRHGRIRYINSVQLPHFFIRIDETKEKPCRDKQNES